AREPLAYIVIGIAEHLERDALAEEGPERLPRGPAQADLDMALRKPCHAEALRDFGGKAGADGAVRVADIIGELHPLAALEERPRIIEDLRVEAVGHRVAEMRALRATFLVGCVDLGEDRIEVEIVKMLGAAADLAKELGAANHLVEAAAAELGEDFAYLFGDEGHEVDDLLGRPCEPGAEFLILRADAHRAGVRVALAHHDAPHRDEAQCPDAIFLGAKDRRDHDVAPGLEAAVGAQPDPVAQAIE